jgi:hypothetical protein
MSTLKESDFSNSPTNNKNKLKQEAIIYSYKIPKSPTNFNFNKPLVTADKVKFNYDHFHCNSPNFYKKSYYTSTFCRNYKKPKILQGIFDYSKSVVTLDDVPEKTSFKSLYNMTLFSPSKESKNRFNTLTVTKYDNNIQSYQSSFLKNQINKLGKNDKNGNVSTNQFYNYKDEFRQNHVSEY